MTDHHLCEVCQGPLNFQHDHKPDWSGLDDGPFLRPPRKKLDPVAPEVERDRRIRAWETRRLKYGRYGHR